MPGLKAVILMLAGWLVAAPALAAPRKAPHWTHGPPDDPAFFPIGVWVQRPDFAEAYRKAGFNVFVGLWHGPTEQQLQQLKRANMLTVCAQNDVGLAHRDDPTIIGWLQQPDEPDNAQGNGQGGFSSFVPPQRMIAQYQKLRAADPTRPVFVNLGEGIANDEWIGHGPSFSPDLYRQYVQCADVLMWDLYPVADLGKKGGGLHDDGQEYLSLIAKGIARLNQWAPGKPVWDHVECTHIHHAKAKATPEQVKAEAWMALVHGSRGLIYFVHEFQPKVNDHALLNDEPMLAAVTEINRQVRELAPVLNTPAEAAGATTVTTADPQLPIDLATHRYKRDTYVFAIGMRNAPTTGSFRVRGAGPGATAEVIGEDRTIRLTDGKFRDDFEPYGVHLYRIHTP